MKRRRIAGALGVVLLVLMSSMAWAQTDTAKIIGTVADTSGAVIPGVAVTVTSEKTRSGRTVLTDEKGFYVLTTLPPATYRVKADLPGFSGGELSGVILQIG